MMENSKRDSLRRAFGRTLRAFRQRAGIAQEDLAYAADINRGYMGGLERGEHSPTLETICKLLPHLGISLVEFATELELQLKRHPRAKKT